MILTERDTGRRETVLRSGDGSEKGSLVPSSTTRRYVCTASPERFNCKQVFAFYALLLPVGILSSQSKKTISKSGCIKNKWITSRNRGILAGILYRLLLVILLSLVPTSNAVGLGLTRQQRNPAYHRPVASPFFDSARSVDATPLDDSTVKIRTIDEKHPPSIPPQQLGGPKVDPWLYNIPPIDPNSQRPAYPPVLVPNYNYYTVYGPPWGYPETRVVGAYGSPLLASQWTPQSYYPRNSMQPRQKMGNKRRKEKSKGEKCPKICDTCLPSHDNADVAIDKERAVLQKRFAAHVKPAIHHKESVGALFKYMDRNGDGFISFTELQNYLLLHNIISPEIPK